MIGDGFGRSRDVRRIALGSAAVLLALAGASLLAPPHSDALSCAPLSERRDFRGSDVVFEGVILSGPRTHDDLASPARVLVSRYLKGRGPGVVAVGTAELQVEPGDHFDTVGAIAGDIHFDPGEAWRIYGDTPGGSGRSAAGGVRPPSLCGHTRRIPPAGALAAVGGSAVGRPEPGSERRWRGRLARGERDLGCIFLALDGRRRRADCRRLGDDSRSLVAIATEDRGAPSTAIAVHARRLEVIAVDGPDGPIEVDAAGQGPIALAVIDGRVDPDSLRIHALRAGGDERVLDPTLRRVLADDPREAPPWEAVAERGHPRRDLTCVRWSRTRARFGDEFAHFLEPPQGECGRLDSDAFFFAVRGHFEHARDAGRARLRRNVLFGAAGPAVESVAVTSPAGSEELPLSVLGRAFVAAFPRSIRHEDLAVTVTLSGGEALVFDGRRSVNLRTPTRPFLGGLF